MGWRAQPTAQVQFDDCKVPADNLVGEEGSDEYAMAGLDGGRLNIAASALGGRNRRLTQPLPIWVNAKLLAKPLINFRPCNLNWPNLR